MSRRRTYSRRRTASQSLDSPERKEENKEENKYEDVKMEEDKKEEEEDRHSSMSESDSSSLTGEYDATMMKMLYEVLQGLAVDILLALEQVGAILMAPFILHMCPSSSFRDHLR